MASKTTQTKAAFVRSQPATMTAKEVSAKAKAAGLSIPESYVWNVRANDKAAAKGKAAGKKSAAPQTASRATAGTNGTGSSQETAFRRLALDVGLGRARQMLTELERKLGDLIAGR